MNYLCISPYTSDEKYGYLLGKTDKFGNQSHCYWLTPNNYMSLKAQFAVIHNLGVSPILIMYKSYNNYLHEFKFNSLVTKGVLSNNPTTA